jgi:hypothetical protein
MTRRGTTHTPPWLRRLALPLAASLAVHGGVLLLRAPTVRFPTLPVVVSPTVEFGLEAPARADARAAHAGAAAPCAAEARGAAAATA